MLERESQLVHAPAPTMPTGDAEPGPGADIWADDTLSSPVSIEGSDGDPLQGTDFIGANMETNKEGLFALEKADLFNLLCIPAHLVVASVNDGDVDGDVLGAAATYCERRRAVLIVDPPAGWSSVALAKAGVDALPDSRKNAAVYFPRLRRPNPLLDGEIENFAPSGAIAGIFARTDAERGVWKAPAGLSATIVGAPQLSIPLTDGEVGQLNPLGVNCLRAMPAAGRVVWGARTLDGNDRLASEWKYIPVRRTALFIEESLYRGTQWVVFEPNDEPLWSQIRLNVGAFMQNLFLQGAFQGATPKEAYLV
ncbi:MAG: phage tail sheath family protein, partial [Pseudonocardiaceae bacterium]